MTRTMYDAVTVGNVPSSATLVAGYGDGYYNNIAAFRARFPHATIVEIAVSSQHNLGVVLDVETGDATPAEAPGWVRMRRAAGVDPTIYCNSSTWPSVRAAFTSAGVAEPHWWIAQYDGDPTLFPGTVAKQYTDPGPYDLSSVAAYWPGVDPAPSEDIVTPADRAAIVADVVAALKAQLPFAVWNYHLASGEPEKANDMHQVVDNIDAHAVSLEAEAKALAAQVANLGAVKLTDAQVAALAGQVVPVLVPQLVAALGHALDGTKP